MFKKKIECQHRENHRVEKGRQKVGDGEVSRDGFSQMRGERSDIFEEEVMVIGTSSEAAG